MALGSFLLLAVFLVNTVLADSWSDVPHYTTECVQINGTLSLNISYIDLENTTSSYIVDISEKAKAISNCSETSSNIILREGGRDLTITFAVNLQKNDTKAEIKPEHWGVTKVEYNYAVSQPDALKKGARYAKVEGVYFMSPVNKSYSCSKEMVNMDKVYTLESGNQTLIPNESVFLNQTHLAIRIGQISPKTPYDYHYCAADQKVKDLVPIAVGVALAALVVIVLVSYLIGRRRTVSAGGYERV